MHQKCELPQRTKICSEQTASPTQMIESKQAAVVWKCPKLNNKLPMTSVQQSLTKYQNIILPAHKKKSHQQQPPASSATGLF
jgi:hypothetical protein